jgi:carboxymethylenebutenolidase
MAYRTIGGWETIPVHETDAPGNKDPLIMGAYLSRPDPEQGAEGKRFPAVLIAHELFGVNDHICDVSDRIAALGYVVLAADYYYRVEPDVRLGYDDESRNKGMAILHLLKREDTIQDIAAAMHYLRNRPEVGGGTGFIGFSMGGHIAFLASTQLPVELTVCFYAGWLTNTDIPLSQPEPTITLAGRIARNDGHVVYFAGGKDHVINGTQLAGIENALKEAGVRHEIIEYPEAGHGFFCDQRSWNFHAPSRDDSWLRLQQLLANEL